MSESAPDLTTRPSLLVRVRDCADGAAWRAFADAYAPLVYGHARRRGLQHSDAEDVRQRVFARVARAMPRFVYRPAAGRFRDWLGRVVRNEVNRHLRRQVHDARAAGALPDGIAAVPQDTDWAAEFSAHVLALALERVRPDFADATWRAFEGVWVARRPAPDVANELGVTVDKVYVAKSRVLKRLWPAVRELAEDAAFPDPAT